jgi:hypothetical protein
MKSAEDWTGSGSISSGTDLDWDYRKCQVHLSMAIPHQHTSFPAPSDKTQTEPTLSTPVEYGAKTQYVRPEDESQILDKEEQYSSCRSPACFYIMHEQSMGQCSHH